MSPFTTRYTEPANIAATIKQATRGKDLSDLYRANATVIARHPHLRAEILRKERQLEAERAPTAAEGWEG